MLARPVYSGTWEERGRAVRRAGKNPPTAREREREREEGEREREREAGEREWEGEGGERDRDIKIGAAIFFIRPLSGGAAGAARRSIISSPLNLDYTLPNSREHTNSFFPLFFLGTLENFIAQCLNFYFPNCQVFLYTSCLKAFGKIKCIKMPLTVNLTDFLPEKHIQTLSDYFPWKDQQFGQFDELSVQSLLESIINGRFLQPG